MDAGRKEEIFHGNLLSAMHMVTLQWHIPMGLDSSAL